MTGSADPHQQPFRKAQMFGVNWWLWRLSLPPLSLAPSEVRGFSTATLIEAHAVLDSLEEAQRRANKEQ